MAKVTVISSAVVALLILTGCVAPNPVPSETEAETTESPEPTAFTASDVLTIEQFKPLATGATAVALPMQSGFGALLYGPESEGPESLFASVDPEEEVTASMWAVESDPDANGLAVGVAYVRTEASGLTQPPDLLRVYAYDYDGVPVATFDLPPPAVGVPQNNGDGQVADDVGYSIAVVDGMLVLATGSPDGYVLVGVSISDEAIAWTVPSAIKPLPCTPIVIGSEVITCWGSGAVSIASRSGAITWSNEQIAVLGGSNGSSMFSAVINNVGNCVLAVSDGHVIVQDARSLAFDPVSGGVSTAYVQTGYAQPAGSPAFISYDSSGSPVFTLDGADAPDITVLGVEAAYDGRTWISSNSGLDIIDSATGDRDPAAEQSFPSGSNYWIPAQATSSWTIFRETQIGPGQEVLLVRHPDGPPAFNELPFVDDRG